MASKKSPVDRPLGADLDDEQVAAAVAQRLKSDHRMSIDSTGETHHREDPRRTLARSKAPSEGERISYSFRIRVKDYQVVEDIAHSERRIVCGEDNKPKVKRKRIFEVMDEALDLLALSRRLAEEAELRETTPYNLLAEFVDSITEKKPKKPATR